MATNLTIMNTVWENATSDYQTRIPQATQDNITTVGNTILSYTVARNEFIDALINKIALTIVSSKMARNRLAAFKNGMLEYGNDVEEIFTDMATANTYDPVKAETESRKRVIPNTEVVYHRSNRKDFYKTSITHNLLKRAFLTSDGLGKLVASIVNSLYSADNHDEYILMKQLVADYFTDDRLDTKYVEVPKVTDQASAQLFMQNVKQTSTDFTFMSTDFNPMGKMQKSEKEEQVLLIHKNVDTLVSTDLLAWAFNANNFDPNVQKIVVDDFGTLTGVQGVLMDKQFFKVYEQLFETTNEFNPEGLSWNYWLHHHQLLSTSPFQNAVMFKIPTTA